MAYFCFSIDVRIGRRISDNISAQSHQEDITKLHPWSQEYNIVFNDSKYQSLRVSNNPNKYDDYNDMTPDYTQPIDEFDTLRNLGVIMSSQGGFQAHISHLLSKVKQKMGWIHRTYITTNVEFCCFMWINYICSNIDYASQLWCPSDQIQMSHLNPSRECIQHVLMDYSIWITGLVLGASDCYQLKEDYSAIELYMYGK